MLDNLINCTKCHRITANFEKLRELYPKYHNRPVKGRGDINSALCILGLAPGLHGANKSGNTFTEDFCSSILHKSLLKNNLYTKYLKEKFYMTNSLKCLPPNNKPSRDELNACLHYLEEEIFKMPKLKNVLVFGKIAHESLIKIFKQKIRKYPFKHGGKYFINNIKIYDSYHCSQINIYTKRLTIAMLDKVIRESSPY